MRAHDVYKALNVFRETSRVTIRGPWADYTSLQVRSIYPLRIVNATDAPKGGVYASGSGRSDALAFIRKHSAALGAPQAPEHIELTNVEDDTAGEPGRVWTFRQSLSGAKCAGCLAYVHIDLRTLKVFDVTTDFIDLPPKPLPAPTTTAKDAEASLRAMRPDLRFVEGETTLVYAQDEANDVELFWEIQVTNRCDKPEKGEQPRAFVAVDTRNLSLRGFFPFTRFIAARRWRGDP